MLTFFKSPRMLLPAMILYLATAHENYSHGHDDHEVLGHRSLSDDQGNVQELLAVIAGAGPQGSGSAEARASCDQLVARNVKVLPALLVAMDTTNPVAANWYRSVFEEIVTREMQREEVTWPSAFLAEYVSDTKRNGRARRRVLRLIDKIDPAFQQKWLPGRLSDPEFRRDAVAVTIKTGDEALQNNNVRVAKAQYRVAFENARDEHQVSQAATKLRALGEEADVLRQLGLVTDWWVLGPFNAPGKSGFGLTFEAEHRVDLTARYRGQKETEIGWIRHRVEDSLGQLNLISVLGRADEAVGYAWTEIHVNEAQSVQLRCGADDCCIVWLNDEVVSAHEQWLNGIRFDRFSDPATLVRGRNTILVKVCQGPQHRNPEVTNNWSLQLRFCNQAGRGISFQSALRSMELD